MRQGGDGGDEEMLCWRKHDVREVKERGRE